MTGPKKTHWDTVYGSKPLTEVSWYEPRPVLSLQFRVANSSSCSPHMICTGLPRGAPSNSSTVAFIDMRARLESKIDSQRNR
jgi:hypothetical protein